MPRENYEMYPEPSWEIYDPNQARTIAVFSSESHARDYLDWLNAKDTPKDTP